ncbi:MAG TPA: amidohydrolase family protein [Mycobacteriales bacterium]|nr:amidohydrolase family protein [Mycobacteriales bacterium]
MTGVTTAGTTTVHRAPWVLPIAAAPVPAGEVAVRDGRIVAVGRELERRPEVADAGPVVVVEHDGVLMPGLVNAHAHLQYGPAFADLATGALPFPEWIGLMMQRRQRLDDDAWLDQAQRSARHALETGTTAVADVVTNAAAAPGRGALRGIAYLEAVGADDVVWAERESPRITAALQSLGGADQAGALIGLSPHTLYTLGTEVFRAVIALARERQVRLHPHLAETEGESAYVRNGTGPLADAVRAMGLSMELLDHGAGCSPTGLLARLGGLGPDVHVAHGIHVDAADRNLLRRNGTTVALCVRSNAVLGAGEAPVAAYRNDGNPVGVGTDSLASAPDLDMLAELRALRDVALRQGSDPEGLAAWLVHAATTGGAAAMGMQQEIGVLRRGARADLVVVQGEPAVDPYQTVLSGRARTTYLAGELVAG